MQSSPICVIREEHSEKSTSRSPRHRKSIEELDKEIITSIKCTKFAKKLNEITKIQLEQNAINSPALEISADGVAGEIL